MRAGRLLAGLQQRPLDPKPTALGTLFWLLQGQMGLAADGEEALLWLGRAARQLAEVVGDSADGGGSGSVGGGSSSGSSNSSGTGSLGTAGAGRRQLPALMSAGQCRHILSQVGGRIGVLESALPHWLRNLRRPCYASALMLGIAPLAPFRLLILGAV